MTIENEHDWSFLAEPRRNHQRSKSDDESSMSCLHFLPPQSMIGLSGGRQSKNQMGSSKWERLKIQPCHACPRPDPVKYPEELTIDRIHSEPRNVGDFFFFDRWIGPYGTLFFLLISEKGYTYLSGPAMMWFRRDFVRHHRLRLVRRLDWHAGSVAQADRYHPSPMGWLIYWTWGTWASHTEWGLTVFLHWWWSEETLSSVRIHVSLRSVGWLHCMNEP